MSGYLRETGTGTVTMSLVYPEHPNLKKMWE
jgi:hypothetical protein